MLAGLHISTRPPTSFEFQLHPVGQVLAGKVVYSMSKAREVLRFHRE